MHDYPLIYENEYSGCDDFSDTEEENDSCYPPAEEMSPSPEDQEKELNGAPGPLEASLNFKYLCKHCDKPFQWKSVFERHMHSHSNEKSHVCPHQECPRRYKSFSALSKHIRDFHCQIKPHKCDQCSYRFNQKSELTVHQLTHTKEKRHQCYQCGQRFSQSSGLGKHLRCHMREGAKSFQCQVSGCRKSYSEASSLFRHHRNKHAAGNTGISTETASVSGGRGTLPENTDSAPFEQPAFPSFCDRRPKSYPCTQCNKVFRFRSLLLNHQVSHSSERAHCCDLCGRSYKLAGDLKTHFLMHLRRECEQKYRCQFASCRKTFTWKSSLQNHIKQVHFGKKSMSVKKHGSDLLRCEQCEHISKNKKALRMHAQIHRTDRPFTCNFCNSSFKRSYHLKRHQKKCAGAGNCTGESTPVSACGSAAEK